MNICCSSH